MFIPLQGCAWALGLSLALVPNTGSRRASAASGGRPSGQSGIQGAPPGWCLEGHPQGTRISHYKRHQMPFTLAWDSWGPDELSS